MQRSCVLLIYTSWCAIRTHAFFSQPLTGSNEQLFGRSYRAHQHGMGQV